MDFEFDLSNRSQTGKSYICTTGQLFFYFEHQRRFRKVEGACSSDKSAPSRSHRLVVPTGCAAHPCFFFFPPTTALVLPSGESAWRPPACGCGESRVVGIPRGRGRFRARCSEGPALLQDCRPAGPVRPLTRAVFPQNTAQANIRQLHEPVRVQEGATDLNRRFRKIGAGIKRG